jgi:FkbM family methyltransferase
MFDTLRFQIFILMINKILKAITYFIYRWVLQRPFLLATIPQYNLKMKCKTADYLGRHLYKRGVYEAELSEFLGLHVPIQTGDIVLDVGANIGWHSLLLARKHPDCKVFSFEPEPENVELLKYNTSINRVSNIEVIPKAASFQQGEEKFYLYANKNAGRHSLLPINKGKVITVPVTSLDYFIREHGLLPDSIKLLKIDVEGYELNVLRGAGSLLGKVPLILLEFSPEFMRKGGINPKDLIDLLEETQYQAHLLEAGQLQAVKSDELMSLPLDQDVFWVLSTSA